MTMSVSVVIIVNVAISRVVDRTVDKYVVDLPGVCVTAVIAIVLVDGLVLHVARNAQNQKINVPLPKNHR